MNGVWDVRVEPAGLWQWQVTVSRPCPVGDESMSWIVWGSYGRARRKGDQAVERYRLNWSA